MRTPAVLSASIFAALALTARAADAPAKVTYNDHVLPIFRNACLNCHNPDKKKAGLDLSTFQAAIAGSDNGKVVDSGNAGNSLLVKCVKQTEDPKMPPKGDKLTDSEIAVIEKWITGQLLETASSKAVAAANNVQVAVVSLDRPAGPPPMPKADLPLEPQVHTQANNALVALAASPWAPLVAIGGQKQIILYNTETLQPLGILPFPEGFPTIVRFSRNGQLLMTGGGLGGKSGQVVLWDVQTGERVGTVGSEFDQVLAADISPDHAHVALGGPGKLVKIYATKDGKLEHSIKKHTDWVTAIAFSPDGKFLASADRNGGVEVWEGSSGKEYNALPGHKVTVTALSFMPGVLASASEDGTVVLWDVKEGKEIRKWNAHKGGVAWVDFTTDGRLVTCGRDKVAMLWDQNGKTLGKTAEPFADIALRAAFSNDRIIAGDWSGEIRVCSLDGKRIGQLTANPPTIAEQLAAAEKQLADAQGALAPLQDALTAAEQKHNAGQAAAEPKPDAAAKTAELQKKLEQQNTEVAALREARAKQKEGTPEYDAANAKVQAKKAEIAQTQSALDAAPKAEPAPRTAPANDEELAKAKAAFDQANAQVATARQQVEHWQRARDFMAVHKAKQTYADLKTKLEDLTAAAKDALAPAEKAKADIAALEKATAEAPASLKHKEAELDQVRAALQPLAKAATDAEAALAAAEAAAKADTEALAKANSDVEAQTKKFNQQNDDLGKLREARAKQKEGAPEYDAANAKVQAKKAELAETQTALDGAKAKVAELKPKAEPAAAAIAKAKEVAEKAKAEIKTATTKATAAEKALAQAKKDMDANAAKLAELRKKAPEIASAAKVAKAAAEREAAEAARELDKAKATAERAQAEFQKRYPASQQSASAAPGPAGSRS